jgi:protein-arginine kinase activator protein McsA
VDRAAELQAQIELAIVEERYEDAAMLRDELKRLRSGPSPDAAV